MLQVEPTSSQDAAKAKLKRTLLKDLERGSVDEDAVAAALRDLDFRLDEVSWCLFDASPAVRRFGLYAIARSSQRDRARQLFKMLAKEKAAPRRLALIQAIALARDPQAFSELGKLANSKDVDSRRLAQQILVRIEGWPSQRELVNAFLEDPEIPIVLDMVRAIVEQDVQQYHGYLRHLAIHENEHVRRQVLQWMVQQHDPSHAEIFFARIAHEQGAIAELLLDALARLADQHPAAMLEWCVQSLADAAASVRRTGLQLFVRLLGVDGAMARLMSYAASVTDWVRDTIYEEAKTHTEAFVGPLLAYLDRERNDKLRFQALHFAYALRDERLLPLFIADWERGDWVTRYQILVVLAEVQSPEARRILDQALEQKETRLVAVRALGAYDDPDALRRLTGILGDSESATQLEIIAVLERRGGARMVPFLARFLEGEGLDREVHAATVRAIEAICERLDVPVPRRVVAISRRQQARALDSLPDLGLRLVPDV
jgi:HEAT repeat protein